MTCEEMKIKFEKDGWNDVNFRELTQQEAKEKGYYFALWDTSTKYFVMIETGNIFNENGDIALYNIRCCKNI